MSNLLPESMLAEIRARAEVVPLEPPFSHGAFAIADRRKLLAHIDACSHAGARVEPGDDPAVLREYLRIYGVHIPPCAGRPCECGFAKAWQVSRLPEPSRGVDTAALNRELCEKEGHVLGVVARPCLRCHEWFDPQYGRSPEPEDLRAEVERLRVERYLCVLAMRCAMGAHHDGVDAMRERLEPVVARYGIATACAARAAISDADAACIEAQYSRSEIAGSSGEPGGGQWQPIETAPKGRTLLLGYWNDLGNWRTVMGCYYAEGTLESETEDSGFAPPGWYESTQAYEYLAALDKEPTHWQPLPKGLPKRPPETKGEK